MLRVPPNNKDAEKAIIGALLMHKDAYEKVTELLDADSFYQDNLKIIFQTISEMKAKGRTVDAISVVDALSGKGMIEQVGGPFTITSCMDAVVNDSHLQTHCRMVAEKYIRRNIIKLGMQFTESGYDEETDTFETVEAVEKQIFDLTNKFSKGDIVRVDSVLIKTLQRLEQMRHREEYITGVPSGFTELDRITCGFQSTDLIILAARPACGKTAFSLNMLLNAAFVQVKDPKTGRAINPYPVGLFNLEMSSEQVVQRVLSNYSKTPLGLIKNARLDDAGMQRLFERGVQRVAGMDIYLDDTPSLNVFEFKSKARRMVERYGVKMIVLDYLQLMKPTGGKQNREQEIATISRELKITAKELKVPIIALSQLSRDVERRGGSPKLSDLRESGAIEQDADMVIFLYGRTESEILADPSLDEDIFLKIAKHRNGELDTIQYQFKRSYQQFIEKGIATSANKVEAAPF
jgi:replicative DNA helicase